MDIFLDYLLGTQPGDLIELRAAHAADIAVDTLVQCEQQARVIMPRTEGAKPIEPMADGHVVVGRGLVATFPAIKARGRVISLRGLFPGRIVLRIVHGTLDLS